MPIVGVSDTNGFDITTNLVFYKTYMPPRHLLVVPNGKDYASGFRANKYIYILSVLIILQPYLDPGNNHVNVFDFGSHLDQVVEQLEKTSGVALRRHNSTRADEIDFAKTSTPNSFER